MKNRFFIAAFFYSLIFLLFTFIFFSSNAVINKSIEISSHKVHFYDRNQNILGTIGEKSQEIKDIPIKIKQAFLAAEDESFYHHKGISIVGIVRAALINLKEGELVQGASTITQQLVRSLYLSRDKTFKRKIKEILLALSIEKSYSKEEIFRLYLNHIYLGRYEQGVGRAASYYFNKSPEDLSYSQAALLAGMARSPSYYDPTKRPEYALKRRNAVLKLMLSSEMITKNTYQEALEEPLGIYEHHVKQDDTGFALASIKKDYFRRFPLLMKNYSELHVTTTIDAKIQKALSKAVKMLHNVHPSLNGAALVFSLKDGSILAIQGSKDFVQSAFNRAFYTKRKVFGLLDDLPLKKQPTYSLLELGQIYYSLITFSLKNSKNLIARVYDETYHKLWNNQKDHTYSHIFSRADRQFIQQSLSVKRAFAKEKAFFFGVDPQRRYVHMISVDEDLMIVGFIEHEDSRKKLPLDQEKEKVVMIQVANRFFTGKGA